MIFEAIIVYRLFLLGVNWYQYNSWQKKKKKKRKKNNEKGKEKWKKGLVLVFHDPTSVDNQISMNINILYTF